jgi:hypothetical protein
LTRIPSQPEFRLLSAFRRLFEGTVYKHRTSNQGDFVASQIYEDLVLVNRSPKLVQRIVTERTRVFNQQNRLHGVSARRGDATFGELVPGQIPKVDPGNVVARGPLATVEIGVEVKILLKAMIKQIDRVINDLRNQVLQFRQGGGNPISVAIVGVNHADHVVSHEGDRAFPTTGRAGFLHPVQEAAEARRRLRTRVADDFDEFLIFRFKATNEEPYPFSWVNPEETRLDYAAALARIGAKYEQRF